jgi:hypothetical protein
MGNVEGTMLSMYLPQILVTGCLSLSASWPMFVSA